MTVYLWKHYDQMLFLFAEHLYLVVLSVAVSLLLAVPAGVFIARSKRLSAVVLSFWGVMYTIPSLAMFSFLLPAFGLGKITAIIVLAIYNQYILVRSTVEGLQSIDSSILDAGYGMGLGHRHMFMKIQIPLALPVLLSGIRIATVSTIGIAAVAAIIHAGGLGVLLFDGLRMNYMPKIVWGAVFASLLAYLANQLLLRMENKARRKARGQWAEK